MHPAEFHYISPSERGVALGGLSIDTGDFISDTYHHLSSEKTNNFLRAIRHGVELAGIEAGLRASEMATSISPVDSIPYRSEIWQSVDVTNGTVTLDPAPYRVIQVRSAIYTPEVQEAEIESITQAGDTTTIEYRRGDIVSFTYSPNTGELTVNGGSYDGEAWIVEARYGNKTAQNYLVNRYEDIEKWRFGPDYPSPHYVHAVRLIEQVRQYGARPDLLYRLASALIGVPFAYDHGTIDKYIKGQGFRQVVISNSDRTTASFLPPAAKVEDLKPTGTTVEEFEPLLEESGSELINTGSDPGWDSPVEVSSTSPTEKSITISGSMSVDLFDRVRLRLLSGDFQDTYIVRYQNGSDIFIEGEVPPVSSSEWAYVQKLNSSGSPNEEIDLTIPTSYQHTDKGMVKNILQATVSPGRPINLTVNDT